jgi:formylglycine-generating enzyme required for sulfatase activity
MRTSTILCILAACCSFVGYAQKSSPEKALPKKLRKELSYIPGGSSVLGKDTTEVKAFFIKREEIKQQEYAAFLAHLRAAKEEETLRIAAIDSMGWLAVGPYNQPYVTYYHAHPAYAPYPIVNITYEAALAYCAWYEKELNKQLAGKYTAEVSLPTSAEWIRAVRGDNHFYTYAWGGPHLRNALGCALCNYAVVGDEAITRNAETRKPEVLTTAIVGPVVIAGHVSDNADILAPTYTYSPNHFGLYNMNGNAREMTATKGVCIGGSWRDTGYDVRNESIATYSTSACDLSFRPIVRLVAIP